MIFSLRNTKFVVQSSPHQECSAEKFDKTFTDCVSFTCFIRLYSYWQEKLANQRARIRPVVVKISIYISYQKTIVFLNSTCSGSRIEVPHIRIPIASRDNLLLPFSLSPFLVMFVSFHWNKQLLLTLGRVQANVLMSEKFATHVLLFPSYRNRVKRIFCVVHDDDGLFWSWRKLYGDAELDERTKPVPGSSSFFNVTYFVRSFAYPLVRIIIERVLKRWDIFVLLPITADLVQSYYMNRPFTLHESSRYLYFYHIFGIFVGYFFLSSRNNRLPLKACLFWKWVNSSVLFGEGERPNYAYSN